MRTKLKHILLAAIAPAMLLTGCQKQDDEPTPKNPTQTVPVKFKTFLKEGDNIRPIELGVGTRAATETLTDGFYLYGHSHNLSFETYTGNSYSAIFENVKVNADGTYAVPKYWIDKAKYHTFQAYAAIDSKGKNRAPTTITFNPTQPPYPSSHYIGTDTPGTLDVLTAITQNIQIADETPTVNLYFEHLFARIVFKVQRMNIGGPTLYDVTLKSNYAKAVQASNVSIGWKKGSPITTIATTLGTVTSATSDITQTIPSFEKGAVFAGDFIYPPQDLSNWTVEMTYKLTPDGPPLTIKTSLPPVSLSSGKQFEYVIGHIVEVDQLVVTSVSLSDWTTTNINVPEYK